MLVLSRKRGERIVIGQNIVLTITEVRGDRVLIGIQAPMEVSVHREEVFQRIQDAGVATAPAGRFHEIAIDADTLNCV